MTVKKWTRSLSNISFSSIPSISVFLESNKHGHVCRKLCNKHGNVCRKLCNKHSHVCRKLCKLLESNKHGNVCRKLFFTSQLFIQSYKYCYLDPDLSSFINMLHKTSTNPFSSITMATTSDLSNSLLQKRSVLWQRARSPVALLSNDIISGMAICCIRDNSSTTSSGCKLKNRANIIYLLHLWYYGLIKTCVHELIAA